MKPPALLALPLLILLTLPTLARSQFNDLVSADASGVAGNDQSFKPSISGDGRYVAFESEAANLVPGDINLLRDVFVKDTQTGTILMASTTSGGQLADGLSKSAYLARNGVWVVFSSNAENLDPAPDPNFLYDIYLRNLATGAVIHVTPPATGSLTFPDNDCHHPSVTDGGRFVAFESAATNLIANDTNNRADVFVRDTVTNITYLASASSPGVPANGLSLEPMISGSGRYLVYQSGATDLVPGITLPEFHIYLFDSGIGTTTLLSQSGGTPGNGVSSSPRISRSGDYAVFTSNASNLVPNDTNGESDIFVYDVANQTLSRESLATGGNQLSDVSLFGSISDDGRFVTFSSAAPELPGGSNSAHQIYLRDRQLNVTILLSRSPAAQLGDSTSHGAVISATTLDVVYSTSATNLLDSDTNGHQDVVTRSPCKASWISYGNGHPGTQHAPTLALAADPILGTQPLLQVTRSSPTPSLGFFFVGFQQASQPTAWDGTLLVDTQVIVPLPLSQPTLSFPILLDDAPSSEAAKIYVQLLEVDAGASAGVAFSQGILIKPGF
jgi:Tol biopolymer transport system component